MKNRKWTVINTYGIRGETNHRTPEAALRAAKHREGEGWIVIDEAGNQWGDYNGREGCKTVNCHIV